jgi:glycosyltransferase involved in cell wall biosynthesis
VTAPSPEAGATRRTWEDRRLSILGPVEPPVGGVSRYCAMLQRELAREGAQAELVDSLREAPAPSSSGPLGGLTQRFAGPETVIARRLVRAGGSAAVIDNMQLFWRRSRYAWLVTSAARIPYVLVIHHGGFPEVTRSYTRKGRHLIARALGRTAGVICMSGAIREAVERLAPHCRVRQLSPLMPSMLPPPATGGGELEGLPPRGSYLCFGGALAAAYGVEEAVRALDVVLHARPEYGAVLLVGSFVKDEPSVAAVRRLIAAHGSERVRIVEDHPQGGRVIANAAVYLRCSTFDSFGLGLYEAASAGVPVVASRLDGRPAWATSYPPGDAGALVTAIEGALTAEARQRAGRHAPSVLADAASNRNATLEFLESTL